MARPIKLLWHLASRDYAEQGASAFIPSGLPLIDETHRVADPLFALLDLDHGFDVPALRAPHPAGPTAPFDKAAPGAVEKLVA